MSLGERLAELRELAGISTRELDRLAGITQGHTSNIERSKTGNVELKTLDRLARVLGVTLDYLVRGEGERPTKDGVLAAIEAARVSKEAVPATGTDDEARS